MFGFQIRGEFLQLKPNTGISFELNNPAYFGNDDQDAIAGDFSFPLNVPLTPHNRRLLYQPQAIDNYYKHITDEPCTVWSRGMSLFPGKISVVSSTNKEARIKVVLTPLRNLKDTKMNELNWGEVFFGADMTTNLAYAKDTAVNPEDYNHIFFPVWNWGFTEKDSYDNSRSEFQNFYNIYTNSFVHQTDIPAMPFLKVSRALELGAQHIGYTLNNAFQGANAELLRLVLYNNFDMLTVDGDDDIIRPDRIKLAQHANPDTDFGDFIKRLSRLFCLAPFTNFWEKIMDLVPLKDLLNDAPRYDWSRKIEREYDLSTEVNIPGRLGYDSIYENAPTDEFFDREPIEYEQNSILTTNNDSPPGLYLEWITDQLWEIFEEGPPYEISRRRATFGSIPPYITDATNKETFTAYLKTFLTAVTTANEGGSNTWTARMPVMQLLGSSYKRKNPYTDRLLFYRGFNPTSKSGTSFPYASSSIYNGARQVVQINGQPAQYGLQWRGPSGLFEQWWKPWFNRLKNKKTLKAKMLLSERDIRSFNFQHKVKLGNREAFVKRLRVTLTANGPQPTDAEFVLL